MIKPWAFEFVHAAHDARGDDPAVVNDWYRGYRDLWVDDEKLGFEGIFFSEHHFGPGYSPAPNLLIANLAALTSTLRIGVLGSVSAYSTPWRVVEEFSMLDQLTQGRLEMGVVSGIPPELAVVGIPKPHAAEVHAETLDVLLSAIENRVISHKGTHYSFENVRITPPFYQSAPSVWTASTSEASARRAGERGLKMCGGFGSIANLTAVYDAYRDGAASAGKPGGPDQLGIRRQVLIVEGDQQGAETRAKAGVEEFFRFSASSLRIPDAAPKQVEPEELIYGTPDVVADEIIRQCQALGAGHFVASFNIFEPDELRKAHELFGKYVIPRLRAAEIG